MNNRIYYLFISILVALQIITVHASTDNVKLIQKDEQYLDVSKDDWFYEYAEQCYRKGIIVGDTDNKFYPANNIKKSDSIAIVSRIHQNYHNNSKIVETEEDWFKAYYDYAYSQNLINDLSYDNISYITREEFVSLLANAFPANEFKPINSFVLEDIPDHESIKKEYQKDVLMLYNAGIITGKDKLQTFMPKSNITRAEVSGFIVRVMEPDMRVKANDTFNKNVGIKSYDLTFLKGYNIEISNNYIIASKHLDGNYENEYKIYDLTLDPMFQINCSGVTENNNIFTTYINKQTNEFKNIIYYDEQGKPINAEPFLYGTDFYNDIAYVQDYDNNIHIINKLGNVINSYNLKEYKLKIISPSIYKNYIPITKSELHDGNLNFFINIETGLIEEFDNLNSYKIYSDFKNNVEVFPSEIFNEFTFNLIDSNAKLLLDKYFLEIKLNQNGYAVLKDNPDNNGNYYGITNNKGEIIVPVKYEFISNINNKNMAIFAEKNSIELKNIENMNTINLSSENNSRYELYDDFILHQYGYEEDFEILDFEGNILISNLSRQKIYDIQNSYILYYGEAENYILYRFIKK